MSVRDTNPQRTIKIGKGETSDTERLIRRDIRGVEIAPIGSAIFKPPENGGLPGVL